MSSDQHFDIGHVASVDLRTTTPSAPVAVGAPAIDNGITIASLSAEGLLSYRPDHCGVIAIANGAVVRAIRSIESDGVPTSAADYEAVGKGGSRTLRLLVLRAEDGGSCTIEHDATPPGTEWEVEERILCQYGLDVQLGSAYMYIQWERMSDVVGRRWRCADWGGYVPATPSDWGQSSPTQVWDGLDRLASEANLAHVSFQGTTAGAGEWTVVYAEAYSSTPRVALQLIGGTNSPHQFVRLTASSTTGFTATAYERASVEVSGINVMSALATTVNGIQVSALVVPQ